MKSKLVLAPILLACSAVVATPAGATGIPVIDAANLIQDIQQFLQLTAQLKQLEDQYQQQVQQYQALTGSRNMGAMFNSLGEQQLRHYAPSSWQQALQVLNDGGLPANAADVEHAAIAFAKAQGLMTKGADIFPGNKGDNPDALAYSANAGVTSVAAGIGQAAFDQTDARMQRVQSYLDQLNSSPDLKAAVDLNGRMLAELNESITQMIQLQAAQMQLMSASNAALLHGKAQDAAFTPYQLK